MPRISKENVEARETLAMELFMDNPELTAADANKTIAKRVAGGSMNHKRLYEIRSKAQSRLLKEGKIKSRPANKRGRRPGQTAHAEPILSANRDIVLPEVETKSFSEMPVDDAACLIRIDSEGQGKWLASVLDQLVGRGLASGKVVYTTKSHALVAGHYDR
jgi:hypothetical protein